MTMMHRADDLLSILRNRFIRRIRFEIQKPPWRIISPLCEKIIRNKKKKKFGKLILSLSKLKLIVVGKIIFRK